MSIALKEFFGFKGLATGHKNPALALVDGAINGVVASEWENPDDPAWKTLSERIADAGVKPAQVVAVWMEMANIHHADGLAYAQELRSESEQVLRLLHSRLPNLKLAYISDRAYAGYANTNLNPEPYPYWTGFSVKWMVQDQLAGQGNLNWDPGAGPVTAPWLEWGPDLWADGENPRGDGLSWQCSDFVGDGTHETQAGSMTSARLLLNFFETDPTTAPWFDRPSSMNGA
jgi:hypothetical protein